MGLQQLHGGISPQQDCRLFAKTRWKDPNSRFQWGCYHHQQNHRLHREHCQRLQPAVPLLVLEACRSPSTPAGSHLQCRLQPGWCESVSCEGFFIFFPATLALLCSCCVIRSFGPFDNCLTSNVADSFKTHFYQMVLQTHLSAGEEVSVCIHPSGNEENLSICVDSHLYDPAYAINIIN